MHRCPTNQSLVGHGSDADLILSAMGRHCETLAETLISNYTNYISLNCFVIYME